MQDSILSKRMAMFSAVMSKIEAYYGASIWNDKLAQEVIDIVRESYKSGPIDSTSPAISASNTNGKAATNGEAA